MLGVEQIEEWLGQEVLDAEGERLGKLDEVFYSTASGEAVFVTVKSGLLGRHSSVVALANASVGRDYLRVAFTAAQIESAGSGVSAQEGIERDDAARLGEAYGVPVAPEDEFEGASVINQRRRETEETRERAQELEAEARRRADDADTARTTAAQAGQDADQKAERAEQAKAQAARARAEAEQGPPA